MNPLLLLSYISQISNNISLYYDFIISSRESTPERLVCITESGSGSPERTILCFSGSAKYNNRSFLHIELI